MNTQRVEGHMPTLKACPFCGEGLVERGDYTEEAAWNWAQHREGSECVIADLRFDIPFNDKPSWLDAWNRRASIERLEKVNEALVRALQECLGSMREYHSMSTPPVKGRLGREIKQAEAALAKEPA